MKVFLQTLGCKVNQYETQAMETLLAARGHTVSTESDGCDVCIVNTCAVTAESGRKSRQTIRHLREKNPDAVIGVCGCYSQISPEDANALNADVVFGSSDRAAFLVAVENAFLTRQRVCQVDDALRRRSFESLPAGNLAGRTRALLKIQDGCCNFCSYCVIPYARGPVRSLPLTQSAEEARLLGEKGYREIVLTGIEIASYGKDFKEKATLADAVCLVSENAPGARLRLGSLEPRIVTEEFCARLSALPNLCPHFHLSLQSGCDETLKRMRRKYDSDRFFRSVQLLRRFFPACGLTADLIVGFPGETEEEFQKTLSFIQKCSFSSMHIFPYSPRPGTPAAAMDGQIPNAVKKARAAEAALVMKAMRETFLISCTGTVQQVLFEQEIAGKCSGHAGNYCRVTVRGTGLHNKVFPVKITGHGQDFLIGVLI